ncbi:MAG: RluA family pseudouridine synthase [Bdellovibrionota bacterium]
MPGEYRKRELIDDVLIVSHRVDDHHEGWRADRFLCTQYKHFSRNKLQTMIDSGRIKMPGKNLKASTTLRPGDVIQVVTDLGHVKEPDVDFNYKVLYEDDHLLGIDKPGNLPVHPAGKFLFNTLLMSLRRERAEWIKTPGQDFFLVHRLDRETSGVILLAKTSATAAKLVEQFRERKTQKRYSAVVAGHPVQERFTVDADIGPDSKSHIRLKMAAFPKGEGTTDALTHFNVVERGKNASLVDCELMTGRQHQIRVHLASVGHPVVGDKLYGPDDQIFLDYIHTRALTDDALGVLKADRQALHSRYLRFYHEPLGQWLELESKLPQDMKELLAK